MDIIRNKKSGYYYIYLEKPQNNYNRLYDADPIYIELPENNNDIELRIKEEYNKNIIKIGNNGTLYFITDFDDYSSNIFNHADIEEKTRFNTTIVDEERNIYDVICRLWKPIDENLVIICNLNSNLKKENQNIALSNITINYNDNNIIILSEIFLKVKQLNYNIPFIYSDYNIIRSESYSDILETYELRFKYESYYNELLFIYSTKFGYTTLNYCKTKKKEIICQITNKQINEVIAYQEDKFRLGAMNYNVGIIDFDLVYIIIEDNYLYRDKFFYVTVKQLLNNISESDSIIAYNLDYIEEFASYHDKNSKFTTDLFYMPFNNGYQSCYFKKKNVTNILLLCLLSGTEEIHMKSIKNYYSIEGIYHHYDFKIDSNIYEETITIDQFGSYIYCIYPEILDFSLEDNLTIKYIMSSPSNLKELKLNPNSSSYLECEDFPGIKKCIVPLSHFTNKTNGDYYSYFKNHLSGYSIHYDANPFKVIFPSWKKEIEIVIENSDNLNEIIVGENGFIVFDIKYINSENEINFSELVNEAIKGSLFDNEEKLEYKLSCKLWILLDNNKRLKCQLEDYLLKYEQNIDLNDIKFIHKDDYKVVIKFINKKIKIIQLDYMISYLSSDKIEINLNENNNIYYLSFKKEYYDGKQLYLYKNNLMFINFD